MKVLVNNSFREYVQFVDDYYPKSSLSCTKNRTIISRLFSIIEITDIYSEITRDTEFNEYFNQIKKQFLLMTYNLPNYNSFFSASLQRSISENALRMTLVMLGLPVEKSDGLPFFRMQEYIKKTEPYNENLYNLKVSCDLLFSYFGSNSKVMHNDNPEANRTHMNYIIGFNTSPSEREMVKLTKFINSIYEFILITFSSSRYINDFTLSLPIKIQLKNVISLEEYRQYFDVE